MAKCKQCDNLAFIFIDDYICKDKEEDDNDYIDDIDKDHECLGFKQRKGKFWLYEGSEF